MSDKFITPKKSIEIRFHEADSMRVRDRSNLNHGERNYTATRSGASCFAREEHKTPAMP
jgi:hypothetical protein